MQLTGSELETELVEVIETVLHGVPLKLGEALAWMSVAALEVRRLRTENQELRERWGIDDRNAGPAEDDRELPVEAPKPPKHRHKFGEDGRCNVVLEAGSMCLKQKAPNGRKPAAPATEAAPAPKAE